MTTFELEVKKAALAREVLNMDNVEIINELSTIVQAVNPKNFPCQHSIEELKEGIPKFFEDINSGNILSHNDIQRK